MVPELKSHFNYLGFYIDSGKIPNKSPLLKPDFKNGQELGFLKIGLTYL
jgi:hypothetical protein